MKLRFLIGCYTNVDHVEGLHLMELDINQKSFKLIKSHELSNPSYLTFSSDRSIIYSVNENHGNDDGISAVRLDQAAAVFSNINQVSAQGIDPCYISIDSLARHVFVANYTDGTLCCIPIQQNGSLGAAVQVIRHELNDMVPSQHTHMHAAVLSPDEKYLLATNLGQDTLSVYKYLPSTEMPLGLNAINVFNFPIGTGPRHLCFGKNRTYCYVVGELDGSLHVLHWISGNLTLVQSIKLMAIDDQRKNSAADLHFGASGDFLYVSNRGDINMLIIFKVNQQNGTIELIGRTNTNGIGPRNFAISPNGNYMLVAHQYAHTLRLFEIDQTSGQIQDTGVCHQLYSPVCVKFL